jgi:cytochrome P450
MPGIHEPLTEQLLDGAFPAADPYPLFAQLRADAPVAWCAEPGFWSVSRMDDVLTVATDTATFCSSKGILVMEIGITYDTPPTMMHTDPPEHTAYRALVSPPLRKRVVEAMDASVRSRAAALVDALPLGEPVDVVAALAVPFPIEVIADLLGLGDADVPRLYEWSEAVIPGATDLTPERAGELALEMTLYLMAEAAKRREMPGDDLISTVALAELDGKRLSDDEVAMFLIQLLVAGNETTRNMVSGGLVAFAQQPAEWQRLRHDASLIPSAVEELLRWTSPVSSFMRTATVDTTLGGTDIAAGDHLLLLYGSADRDEAAFGPTADRLDVGRTPNHHVAFGFGAHFCLGAALARLEAQVLLGLLLGRVGSFELAGAIVPSPSTVIAGMKAAPMILRPV